jgi:hypothetical protein
MPAGNCRELAGCVFGKWCFSVEMNLTAGGLDMYGYSGRGRNRSWTGKILWEGSGPVLYGSCLRPISVGHESQIAVCDRDHGPMMGDVTHRQTSKKGLNVGASKKALAKCVQSIAPLCR